MNPEAHRYRRSSIRNPALIRQSSARLRACGGSLGGIGRCESARTGAGWGIASLPVAHVTRVASVREVDLARGGPVDSDKSLDECGCAPTPEERRGLWPTVTRRRVLALGAFGAAVLGVGGVAGPMLPAAFAADYPSWDDVQAAMANESA